MDIQLEIDASEKGIEQLILLTDPADREAGFAWLQRLWPALAELDVRARNPQIAPPSQREDGTAWVRSAPRG